MRRLFCRLYICLIAFIAIMPTYAYDFQSGGIYYNILEGNNVEVTSGDAKYKGNIVIPKSVTYKGRNYSVTNIGYLAFGGCIDMSSITIPNSVTSIGSYAFYDCRMLTTITIPNSVEVIESGTFSECIGLTSIVIPNSVKSIESNVFYDCIELSSVTIPSSVTSIGYRAFARCKNLKSITIPNSVKKIFCKAFYGCSYLVNITFPNSLTKVEDEAFGGTAWYNNLSDGLIYVGNVAYKYKGKVPTNTSIVIKEGTSVINDSLFMKCKDLKTITMPNSVTTIGIRTFEECSELTSVTMSNSVTSIGFRAFYRCIKLTSITIPNSMTIIEDEVFDGCSNLTSITIPNSVTSIGKYAFMYCGFTSITIPNSLISIGYYAFYGCNSLASIIVEGGNNTYDSRNNCNAIIETSTNTLLKGCNNTVIPNSVTTIELSAFSGCGGLTSIIIPNSVTSIGSFAFSGCKGLTSITIPNSVTNIGENAFSNCSALTSILSKIVNPFGIKENVFSDYSMPTLTVPSGTKSAYQSTAGWNKFTNIVEADDNNTSPKRTIHVATAGTLPNLISESEKYIIEELTLTGELNGTDFRLLRDMAGCNYLGEETAGKLTVLDFSDAKIVAGGGKYVDTNSLPGWNSTFSYTVEKNDVLPQHVFHGCKFISVIISNRVTHIDKAAFYYCRDLTSITIPTSVTGIEDSAFRDCRSLNSITIPNSVMSIGYAAFRDCRGLTSITIPNSVASIGEAAFRDCSNISSITIPNSVTSIGDYAFYNCSGLTSIVSEIVKPFAISDNVFSDYSKPTLTVPSGMKSAYQTTAGWNKFTNIVESTSNNQKIADPVDLGLSVKWASWNIGASKVGDYGGLYGAGDPTGEKTSTKTSDYYFKNGESICGTEYDLAHVKWGEPWRMPTWNEVEELINNCTWSDGEVDGVKGSWVKGPNGNSIFLPWAGNRYGSSTFSDKGVKGYYYSGDMGVSQHNYGYKDFDIKSGGVFQIDGSSNYYGQSIRPVYGEMNQSQSIVVTAKSLTREYGDVNPTFEYSVSGGSIDGTPKITCSATMTTSVGTYTIKIEKGSVTNSNVTFVDGTLTINKAPLTITANSYTRKQGEANPTFDVTYSGFKNDETSSVLTTKPTCSTTATTSSSPGTYTITVSGAQAQNYNISYVNGTLTITEKSQVSFTQQGITYLGTTSTLKAEVRSVNDGNVVIPATVVYNGSSYDVTSIADGVLSNRTFDYVSLPSTITSLESGTFSNSTLGALIWNANTSLPSNVISNMAMPTSANFLLYVNKKGFAPSNVSNVVVDNTASSIILKDGIDTKFYCPKSFTAQTISYTHHYGMMTGGNGKGWETIALPFDVQRIEHKTKGVITPFASYQSGSEQRPFWLCELGSNGFKRTASIKANTPYIISMPNSSNYDEEYNLAGDVTFSATNVTVAETASLTTSTSKDKTFIPAFAVKDKTSSVYALNVSNELVNNSSANAGSEFVSDLRSVYPFEAYMITSSSSARSLSIVFDDGTTGVDEIPLREQKAGIVKVYNLTGMLLLSVPRSDFAEKWQSLPSGVFIVNGQKMIKTDDAQYNIVQ